MVDSVLRGRAWLVVLAALVGYTLTGCATGPNDQSVAIDSPVASDPLAAWVGEFDYEELLGSTDDASSQSSIDYHIAIVQSDSGYTATVSLNGFQTQQNLLANVIGDATKISLVFTDYTGANLWQPYHQGDLLFTLEWQGSELVTTWGALTPQLEQNQAPGQYFIGGVG